MSAVKEVPPPGTGLPKTSYPHPVKTSGPLRLIVRVSDPYTSVPAFLFAPKLRFFGIEACPAPVMPAPIACSELECDSALPSASHGLRVLDVRALGPPFLYSVSSAVASVNPGIPASVPYLVVNGTNSVSKLPTAALTQTSSLPLQTWLSSVLSLITNG